jgi:hypothetical protein
MTYTFDIYISSDENKYAGLPRNQIKLRNKQSLIELNYQLPKTKWSIKVKTNNIISPYIMSVFSYQFKPKFSSS